MIKRAVIAVLAISGLIALLVAISLSSPTTEAAGPSEPPPRARIAGADHNVQETRYQLAVEASRSEERDDRRWEAKQERIQERKEAAREAAREAEREAAEQEQAAEPEPAPSYKGGGSQELPSLLAMIRANESGGNYAAVNPGGCEGYGCFGAYQLHGLYMDDWARRYGAAGYAGTPASHWPPEVQDRVALGLFYSTNPDGSHWCNFTSYC